ncbi:response regulator transcription factor [Candidatus Entotheonella palauensis]|uniref:Response regulatory domain-containing protein n=1 Tax=Candidatus Entotheonella gemina TaxID=1429439 RepID=W4LZE2_9BACT|nr:response regulator transcription factor [Candidatus Entotheonella palauensis]ETX03459.1 MAG: hypothetical protein ETSY2_33425 [Candidatus Entotheonella gemina]
MRAVKVLLANQPLAARQFLEAIFRQQSDVQLVGTVLDPIELLIEVEHTEADVVVITLPDSGDIPGICSHLLHQYPQLLILALSADCQRACTYQQVIATEPLAVASEENILLAIRRVPFAE